MAVKAVQFHKPNKLAGKGAQLDFNMFATELSQAQYALGQLEGSHRELQSSALLVSPLTAKEATVSSRIEGTLSTVSDIFVSEAGGTTKHADIHQVTNYRKAMRFATSELQRGRRLTPHLVKTLHQTLLEGVRHAGTLGQFRNDAVWIGEKRSDPIEKALYVPPEHFLVPEYIDDLFEYIERGTDDALLRSGIAHYQFEAIHPFDDGNGRIGRLLIPLILFYKKRITQPILYISGYFDAHSDEYREALRSVDRTGRLEPWLKFFLHSVAEQLKETQQLIDDIYSLHHHVKERFTNTRSPYLLPFVEFIFQAPIFSASMIRDRVGVADKKTVRDLIATLMNARLVTLAPYHDGDRRVKLYEFRPLLDLLK